MLVNVGYLLVVDKSLVLPKTPHGPPGSIDLVTLFFYELFGENNDRAARAMAGIIAFSIFGTLWVMTFTASRIKQEIAKEGILPKSLYIAASYTTPYGLVKRWFSKETIPDEELEKAPTLAFLVHWLSSLVLIAAVSPISDPRKAYYLLVSLYAYSINTLVGCWVASGLLVLKLQKSKWHWQDRRRYRPWLSPVHAIIYVVATAFLAITVFIPPTKGSPFTEAVSGFPYYLVPIIGATAPLWGIIWYFGLRLYGWYSGRQLNVTREAFWMPDPDCPNEYVQQAEIIDVTWQITPRDNMSDGFSTSLVDLKNPSIVTERDVVDGDNGSQLEASRSSKHFEQGPVSGARRLSDSFDD
jgi:amino acid transporter